MFTRITRNYRYSKSILSAPEGGNKIRRVQGVARRARLDTCTHLYSSTMASRRAGRPVEFTYRQITSQCSIDVSDSLPRRWFIQDAEARYAVLTADKDTSHATRKLGCLKWSFDRRERLLHAVDESAALRTRSRVGKLGVVWSGANVRIFEYLNSGRLLIQLTVDRLVTDEFSNA